MENKLQLMTEAIRKGLQAKRNPDLLTCGAGRAYVCLSSSEDRKTLNAFKKACEANGLRYIGKAYGSGSRAAYVGYDNFDGKALSQAKAIEAELLEVGVKAYWDGVSD